MKIVILSKEFYEKHKDCTEFLTKESDRPYVCLSIQIDGLDYAIPFRHHIHHPYAFMTGKETGIDYTKSVILDGPEDILKPAYVDKTEYSIIVKNEYQIAKGLERYIKKLKKELLLEPEKRRTRIVECSTLTFFSNYLFK